MASGSFLIAIDNTKIDSTLTDFPVMIYLAASCGTGAFDATQIFDDLGANSKKIKVKNSSGTELYCEIEMWDDTAEEAVLHVKVDSVSSSADTELTLEWDSTWADNTTYIGDTGDTAAESVWDNSFAAVYHMNQDPSGGAGCILDSTGNSNDGTPVGSMTSGDLVDSDYGKAIAFDGSDDAIDLGDSAIENSWVGGSGVITVEAYLKKTSDGIISAKYNTSDGNHRGFRFGIYPDPGDYLYLAYEDNDVNDRRFFRGNTVLSDSTYYYLAGIYDATQGDGNDGADRVDLFVGTTAQSLTSLFSSGSMSDVDMENNDAHLGIMSYLDTSGAVTGTPTSGEVREIRFSSTVRSAAWIKATNESLTNALVSFSKGIYLESGSYVVTGSDVTLTKDVGTIELELDSGSYTITGSDVELTVDRNISLESGAYTVTGSDVALTADRNLDLDAGAYTVTGATMNFAKTKVGVSRYWLVDVSTYYWSQADVEFDGNDYDAKIITGSFSGITLRRSSDESGLCNLSGVSFDISDPPAGVDLTGETLTLRLLLAGKVVETFVMSVRRYERLYGKAKVHCTSLLEKCLETYHPITKQPRSIWPSEEADAEDDYVVPQIFGSAMIPVRSVNTGTERKYILGDSSYTYSITRIRTPLNWAGGKHSWLASEYTMTQTTEDGYRLLQPIIHDSDGDGAADASGLWKSGAFFLDPALKYTSTEISSADTVSPDVVLEKFFEDIGVPSALIDSSGTFADAATQYATWNIEWVGGFYRQIPAEQRLANLLNQCNSYVLMTDKIKLYPRSSTSVLTVDKDDVIVDSFRYSPIWPSDNDGGYIEYVQGAGTPQNVTNKLVVPSDPAVTTTAGIENPESTTLSVVYLRDVTGYDASSVAQRLGVMFFNRKQKKINRLNFRLIPTESHLQLKPDQVITISDTLYGATRDVLIVSVGIDEDIAVSVEAVEFSTGIIDFTDSSPITYTAGDDTGTTAMQSVTSNQVEGIVVCDTQADYDGLTPEDETLYLIKVET